MKKLPRAYFLAVIGALLGIVGLHRFYLNRYISGGIMLFLFIGGVGAMALGYALLLSPMIAELVQSGGQLSALPEMEYLNLDPKIRYWFTGGGLSSLAALCWWAVDLLTMSELVKKSNDREETHE